MPATTVPNHKQKELALTLMELLINAASENKSYRKPREKEMNLQNSPLNVFRQSLVYIRQSSPNQVLHHQESQRRQYGLVDRARELGFQQVDRYR